LEISQSHREIRHNKCNNFGYSVSTLIKLPSKSQTSLPRRSRTFSQQNYVHLTIPVSLYRIGKFSQLSVPVRVFDDIFSDISSLEPGLVFSLRSVTVGPRASQIRADLRGNFDYS
jgi:hypothetical protein